MKVAMVNYRQTTKIERNDIDDGIRMLNHINDNIRMLTHVRSPSGDPGR